jgi:hypothetical protein
VLERWRNASPQFANKSQRRKETIMRKFPVLLIGTTLAASPLAMAGPDVLTDAQLERVSAGSSSYGQGNGAAGSGGAIVGNSSTANLTTSGDVTIGDSVQQGVRAVNLVNSAESGVANGVNVWDGRIETQTTATQLNVEQSNSIVQDQSRMASLPTYVRTEANVDHSFTESSETTHTGMVDTAQKVLGQELQGGMGVSIAGQLDADLTGGTIDLSNSISGSFSGTIGGDVSGIFTDISTSSETVIEASTEQHLSWTLPDLILSLKGAGCYVEIGSCDSSGSYKSSSTETTNTRSPFTLENAKAEHIVVDGSTLDASNSYNVALSGNAQGNVRAVNLVNAAGSVVANAVNVSRTPTVGPQLNLNQVNTIVQRR